MLFFQFHSNKGTLNIAVKTLHCYILLYTNNNTIILLLSEKIIIIKTLLYSCYKDFTIQSSGSLSTYLVTPSFLNVSYDFIVSILVIKYTIHIVIMRNCRLFLPKLLE